MHCSLFWSLFYFIYILTFIVSLYPSNSKFFLYLDGHSNDLNDLFIGILCSFINVVLLISTFFWKLKNSVTSGRKYILNLIFIVLYITIMPISILDFDDYYFFSYIKFFLFFVLLITPLILSILMHIVYQEKTYKDMTRTGP